MKQFISQEQFEKLSFKEQLAVMQAIGYSKYESCNHYNDICGKDYSLIINQLTIGKLYEILEAKSGATQQIVNEGGRYSVGINPKMGYSTAWYSGYYDEVCDALWKAVVHCIKEEEDKKEKKEEPKDE